MLSTNNVLQTNNIYVKILACTIIIYFLFALLNRTKMQIQFPLNLYHANHFYT
nr:MAG TPA: hypothetical protein [Caudoviricetes sp.]